MGIASGEPGRGRWGMGSGSLVRQLVAWYAVAVALTVAAVAIALATVLPRPPGRSAAGLAWSAAALAGVLLIGLGALMLVQRQFVRPMQDAVRAIRSVQDGQQELRLPVTGCAELRELAKAVNVQTEEASRLRGEEAERHRLLRVARQTVAHIREQRQVEEVLREARLAIERDLAADRVYLHLVRDGGIGPPVGGSEWAMPPDVLKHLPQEAHTIVHDLLARSGSLVIKDLQGPEGDMVPEPLRAALRAAGIVSELLTPFGESAEFFGIVVATRMHRGHPWTPAEVEAVEWIAGDLGQALRQAQVSEQETRLVAELQEVDRAKSHFLATVSHELRTPLTSIAGYVELLGDEGHGRLTRAQRQMLGTVERNTARLRQLIEDLLTLSRIESGTFRTFMAPVDLAGLAAAEVSALRPQAEAKGLALVAEPLPEPVLVNGDRGQLGRMLRHLLSNALKFTPGGGQVEVAVTTGDGRAEVRVSDTGIGIPEADQEHLSSRFFRASNAIRRSIPGTGIGLMIVRSIVGNHAGEFELRSAEGRGTSATVRIPLRPRGDWQGRG